MNLHFIAHEPKDTVGVVVVEKVKSGQEVTGWIMETDKTEKLKALADVPLGHKLALTEIKNGETIVKYGNDIGRAIEDIPKGGYVHVHNFTTKRCYWENGLKLFMDIVVITDEQVSGTM